MRALRVVGVTGDGSVVLEDPGRRERYTVPADEQLRAAARGDVTRLGQIAIELESQLRPREIQARIRGGASVDEVAAAAGVPTQKIERFAYPVLLERSRTAELAQGAHPQRADGPDSRTLGETVAHTFGLRGQDYGGAGWDSWKGEDGKWVVVLTWQTGRSDNAAHWAFQPGAHGGTVVALDEHASDLVEGLPARPLRPLGAVVDMARDEDHTPQAPTTAAPARAVAAAGGQQPEAWAGRGIAPEQRRASPPPPRTRVETPGRTVGARPDDTRAPAAAAPVVPRRAEQVEDAGSSAAAGTSQADSATTDGTAAATADAPGADTTAAAGTGTGTTGATPNGSASTGTSPDDVSSDGVSSHVSAPAAAAPVGAGPTGRGSTASDTTDADPGAPVPAGTGSAAPHGTGTDAAATDAVAPAATDAGDTTASGAETSATDSGSADDAAGPAASSATTSPEAATATPASDAAPTTTNPGSATAAPAQDTGTAASTTPAPTTPAPTTPASAGTAAGFTSTSAENGEASPAASGDAPDEGADAPTGTAAAATGAPGTSSSNGSEQETDPSPAQDTESAAPRRPSTAGSRRTKKGKPVMPSWDEVLLGVRGQR
ncbi:hypothetical protein GCM10009772_07930 [Pseudonocardia alni subsp. carboxydivorans]|uniref:Septation protein SepH n=1 Tax=Pseudonocardia alni subsp. carboxydivorans TaxID=415010 RepID=A0ABU9AFR3_PSEA5